MKLLPNNFNYIRGIPPTTLLGIAIFWLFVPGATAILAVWGASAVYSSEDSAEIPVP